MTEQWNLKVKVAKYDNEPMKEKSTFEVDSVLTVQIEPHATVNMLKQKMGMILLAHPKHMQIAMEGGESLDDMTLLKDVPTLSEKLLIDVHVSVPPEPKEEAVVISEDEGLFQGEEAEMPPLPSEDVIGKELSDADMDKQCELKGQAQDLLEDGDTAAALEKFTQAMMLGGVSAMMVAKRAEMLLKQKRYKAAAEDASLALKLNPDSAKAYKARGKARRFLGDYEGSSSDLSQAQKIDYDDGIADMHSYVQKRVAKMQLKKKQDGEA